MKTDTCTCDSPCEAPEPLLMYKRLTFVSVCCMLAAVAFQSAEVEEVCSVIFNCSTNDVHSLPTEVRTKFKPV